jgi:hypothetical protein
MEVANRFAEGEDAYNNKRVRSPEVDRTSRQRRRSRIKDSRTRRNQIATGHERRDEEGYRSREFQNRNTHEKEKPKYSVPSAEDMLHGPCRIHYAYLDGKRVSNHQMKDCRTFLRLQNAMELNQGAHRGGTSTSQGYQLQRLARQLASKSVHICNDAASPKFQKRTEEHIKTSKLSNIITTSNYRILEVVRLACQVQQSRPPKKKVPRPGHAPMVLKAQIGGYGIGRVFMDARSGINLIYARTLRAMSISLENLKPTDCSFHGIVPGSANYPLGKIELYVCVGDSGNYRREKLEFEVMDWPSQYHAILGWPAFAKFMAVPHYAYLTLKIPGSKGTITVQGSFKVSNTCDKEFNRMA